MKKLLIFSLVLLVSAAMQAQEKNVKTAPQSFVAFNLGPSIPVGAFGSSSVDNLDAGFATTGYHLNLTYGHQFQRNTSLVVSALYNWNSIKQGGVTLKDDASNQTITLNMDHWQFYGLAAGPMVSLNLGKKVYTDFKIMIGAVNANSPKMSYQGMDITKENWNMAAMYQGGVAVRIDAGRHLFMAAGADYLYLRPTFKYEFSDVIGEQIRSGKFQQKMSVVNITAGLGYRF